MAQASHEKTDQGQQSNKVRLAASSEDITRRQEPAKDRIPGFFETAHWTADGTTILTSASSNQISGYVVPRDLLEHHDEPLTLSPQSTINLGETSNVLASAPYFNLADPYTNQLLVSSRDHPIQLYYLFPPSSDGTDIPSHTPASSYPLIKARSETFLSATSLLWPSPGSHFIAGCRNFIAKFDASRTGEEPILRIKTIPSERHLLKGGGVGMRGTVSTLAAQPPDQNHTSVVAAGTWTRWVGLYDFAQAGECISTWSIADAVKETARGSRDGIGGDGITETKWSPCGRYLLLSERKSRGILVYDVRVMGQLLGWLEDRDALSNQRVHCDVFPSQDEFGGFEVWSGTTSGAVKVWEGVGHHAGAQPPAWDWQAHDSTVGSTCLHPTGTVIATCSGAWEFPADESQPTDQQHENERDGGDPQDKDKSETWMHRRSKESTLKIWDLNVSNGMS
ncbi:hypothetical protein JX265_011446 [Neoarthrinium moseri]|uniref:Uncharacterized protein n=1 Tax=Neoarthrinium moseri TaxID=1658444 RepID=A0A9P9WCG7_9PEZI|nr:hypothetical protein JX265_011446 [Neoarthrinium moseri]